MIDVTNEYDVSEEVVEHDSTFQMEEEIAPDNSNDAIHVRSMDGNTYLMDRNTINWEETSNNIGIMYQNLEMLQSALMNQLHAATQSADLATKDTMDMVKPFVNDFGLFPKYDQVYSDASESLIATLYCIDAIELIHTILREVYAWMSAKAHEGLFNFIQNLNDQQEENENEDPVQEDCDERDPGEDE